MNTEGQALTERQEPNMNENTADLAPLSRKAKRGETVVLVDGTEWDVHRANVDGDVWLAIDGAGLHGPYDTTEYRVVVAQEDDHR